MKMWEPDGGGLNKILKASKYVEDMASPKRGSEKKLNEVVKAKLKHP